MADLGISVQLQGLEKVQQGIDQLNNKIDDLGKRARKSAESTTAFGSSLNSMLSRIATVATATAAVRYMSNLEDSMEKSARAANRLGVSFERFQGLELIAKRSGLSIDVVNLALTTLAKNAGEALANPMSMQSRLFNALGVSSQFLARNIDNTDAIFRKTITGITELGSRIEKNKAITALFGDQAVALFEAFDQGNVTIDEMIKRFKEQGLLLDNKVAPELRSLNSDFQDIVTSGETFVKKVLVGGMLAAEDLASGFSGLIEQMQTMVGIGERAARQREIAAASRNADQGTAEWDWSKLSLVRKPAATPPPPSIQFEDLSAGMVANFKARASRTLGGAEDTRAIAFAQRYIELIKQLDGQIVALSSHEGPLNSRLQYQQALVQTNTKEGTKHSAELKERYRRLVELEDEQKAYNERLAMANQEIAQSRQLYEDLKSPLDHYEDQLQDLDDMLKKGLITQELYNKARQKAIGDLANQNPIAKGIGDAISSDLERAINSGKWKDLGKSLGKDIEQTLVHELLTKNVASAITQLLGGGKPGASPFQGFIDSLKNIFGEKSPFLKSLSDILGSDSSFLSKLADILSKSWDSLSNVLGDVLSGVGGSLGGAGNFIGDAIGAIGSFLGFAGGGDLTVTRPQLVMVGERGPERLSVRPMAGGLHGEGGGGVHVHLPASSVISNITAGTFARQIARTVARENRRRV